MAEKQYNQYIIALVKDFPVIYNNKMDVESRKVRNRAFEDITIFINKKFSENRTRKNF